MKERNNARSAPRQLREQISTMPEKRTLQTHSNLKKKQKQQKKKATKTLKLNNRR